MRFNKAQIIILGVLLATVGVLIYLNFKTPTEVPSEYEGNAGEFYAKPFSLDDYFAVVYDSLDAGSRDFINELLELNKQDTSNIYPKLKLAQVYDSLGFPLASGFYYNQIANKLNDENSWYKAGFKYYETAATTEDSITQNFATQKAINAFEKVILLDADNIEAKNALAICYIKNDQDIMKAVQLLKDVTRRDSSNIDANYTLGILSMRSGQMDKAVQRFELLTKVQPLNPEFYYYLGECYVSLGKKPEAIKAFETFKQLVPSQEAKDNIQLTINNLKNK